MPEILLPPLPEPCRYAAVTNFQGASEYRSLSSDDETHTARFSIDQLRARDLAVAQAVIEACAKVCDEIENGKWPDGVVAAGMAWECADAIRAIQIEVTDADR